MKGEKMDNQTKEGFFSNLPRKPLFLNIIIWVQIIEFVLGSIKTIPNLFLNFSISNLLLWLLSLCVFISVLGLIKLKKWGLYGYVILSIIHFAIWIPILYKMLYISSSPLSSNTFFLLALVGGLIFIAIEVIYLYCIRRFFTLNQGQELLKPRKPVKTVLVVVGVIASIMVALIVLFLILFFYFMSNPKKAEQFGNTFFTQQFILLCKQQPQEKQNRCFAFSAGTLENQNICNEAPNKNECISLIGKVDPNEFKTNKK